jgi:class 3 adenylate cyclase/tetratricopeptide (TPR) repeat protein
VQPYGRNVATCPRCLAETRPGDVACSSCGESLPASADGTVEERKVVSVLFCDLVGFTSFAEGADPEDVHGTLAAYHRIVRIEIMRLGGTVEKFIGDAVMAVFGAPVVRDDDAHRAVRAGLGILTAIEALNRDLAPVNVAVRIGIATGEVLVTLSAHPEAGEGFVTGDIVNTAARLQSAGPVGAVVVNEATWRRTRRVVDFSALPAVTVKGKSQALALWRAEGVSSEHELVDPVGTPIGFRARESELAELARGLDNVIRTRRADVTAVLGEAGVGKTALVRESEQRAGRARWIRGRCLPRGESHALAVVSQWLEGLLELGGPRSTECVAGILRASISGLFGDSDEPDRDWLHARVGPLLGLPSATGAPRDELFMAWSRYLVAVARQTPIVLIADDAHWADPVLVDYLDVLTEHARGAPLEILMLARPNPTSPTFPTSVATRIHVPPLSDTELLELLPQLFGAASVSPALGRLLVERSGGNPLFANEFALMLEEGGWIARNDHVADLDRPDLAVELPATVHAVISARVDALPDRLKRALMDAAVLGQSFTGAELDAVAEPRRDRASSTAMLSELIERDLIRSDHPSGSRANSYSFTHAPVQEVAYAEIPRGDRLRRHERAAAWWADPSDDVSPDRFQRAAGHAERAFALARQTLDVAGQHRLRDLAVRCRVLAATEAEGLDLEFTHNHYERAVQLAMVDLGPPQPDVADLLVGLGRACTDIGRYDEADKHLSAAVELLRDDDDRSQNAERLGWALMSLGHVRYRVGSADQSLELFAEAATALASEQSDRAQFEALVARHMVAFSRGFLAEDLESTTRMCELADRLDDPELIVRALHYRGMWFYELGDKDGALEAARLGLATAQNQCSTSAWLAWMYCSAAAAMNDHSPHQALDLIDTGLSLARRRGADDVSAWISTAMRPIILTYLGRWDEVLQSVGNDRTWLVRSNRRDVELFGYLNEATVYLYRGLLGKAHELLRPHLDALRNQGMPEMRRWTGVLVACTTIVSQDPAARREADDALRRLLSESSNNGISAMAATVARHLAATHDLDTLRTFVDLQPARTGRQIVNSILTARAILAEAEGDIATAAQTYLAAAEAWQSFGCVYEQAQALVGAARCQPTAPAERTRLLEPALAIAELLRAEPLLDEIRRLAP